MKRGTRVQVPVSRGVLMPEIASMTEDLPVDCWPVGLRSVFSKDVSMVTDPELRSGGWKSPVCLAQAVPGYWR